MSSYLARRGGIWWVRLVVPVRLRDAVGRREFIQSSRTHELPIAKLVASVLLVGWRQQLLKLDSHTMSSDVLKLVDASPILSGTGWVSLGEAASLSGISQDQLLRAVEKGKLGLFSRLFQVSGYVLAMDALDLNDPSAGRAGGVVIPQSSVMPSHALETTQTGVLRLSDSVGVASVILACSLQSIEIVSFDVPGQPGMLFAPDMNVNVAVEKLEVLAAEVEVIRQRLAQGVTADAIQRAQELQKVSLTGGIAHSAGRKAHKLFSEALQAYAVAPSGIPGSVTSVAEQKQKRRGCSLFIELVGDLPLREVTADRLREFREKLKSLLAKVNNIPKRYLREKMTATAQALLDDGVIWPMMSVTAQHERLQWVGQMFAWLLSQAWVTENPMAAVLGEQTQTAAVRKTLRQEAAARAETEDDDVRRAFTPDELKLIFGQVHYKTGKGASLKGNVKWYPFEYWLPIIGLFTGCRIGEICQLRLDDIRLSEEGVWYFDINETTPDKSLKNVNAIRHVPVAPMLIELGLIAYRDRLRKEGYKRLFTELTCAQSDARYAKEPGRKMSALLAGLGMPRDSTRVFHCLRANFNNAMLRVPFTSLPFDDPDVKRFIRLKIVGHKLEGVNENHYSSTTMTEKYALVQGVKYDLPEIAKLDIEYAVNAVREGLSNKKGSRRGVEDMGPTA
jgi:integrase